MGNRVDRDEAMIKSFQGIYFYLTFIFVQCDYTVYSK